MTAPPSTTTDRRHATRKANAPTEPHAATAEDITTRHPTEEVPA